MKNSSKFLMICVLFFQVNMALTMDKDDQAGIALFVQDIKDSFGACDDAKPSVEQVLQGVKNLENRLVKRGLPLKFIAKISLEVINIGLPLIDRIPAEIVGVSADEKSCLKKACRLVTRYYTKELDKAQFAIDLAAHLEKCGSHEKAIASKLLHLDLDFSAVRAKVEANPANKEFCDAIKDNFVVLVGMYNIVKDAYQSDVEKALQVSSDFDGF